MVVILIDGGGLPIGLQVPLTVEDLIDELSKFQITQFKGMEVMHSQGKASLRAIAWQSRTVQVVHFTSVQLPQSHLVRNDEVGKLRQNNLIIRQKS